MVHLVDIAEDLEAGVTDATCRRRIWVDRKGATAIEYGLVAALIAVSAIGAMTSTGARISKTFNTAAGSLVK